MRPVNQLPLSLMAMKRSPLASSRRPDSPPKPRNEEVRISPLRYSSASKRTRERSLVSNDGSGRAFTSIATGAVTEYSSGLYFGGRSNAVCAGANCGSATAETPATVDFRKRRRLIGERMPLRMQSLRPAGRPRDPVGLAEQFGEFLGDGAAEFFGIDDGYRAAIIARDVVADADLDLLHQRDGIHLHADMSD